MKPPKAKRAKKPKQERVCIDGLWYNVSAKTGRVSTVPLTRCSNTKTEAGHKGWVLSGLRALTKKWLPAQQAWQLNKRPNQSDSKHKDEHQCAMCLGWFVKKKIGPKKMSVELDHIIPVGGLDSFDKLPVWVERSFVEIDAYQKLCYSCHQQKTQQERRAKCKKK